MGKKQKRKKRIQQIYGTTGGDVGELIVNVDQRTGEISFGSPMTNVYSEVSYERTKAPKVISRVAQEGRSLSFDPEDAVLKHYDFLCAVDTNTRTIRDYQVSVTAVITFAEAPPPPGAKRYWQLDVPFCWEFIGLKTQKPENFGWLAALEEMVYRRLIASQKRIGMLVDSDLGNIGAYNAREKPFFGDVLLPNNIKLIYASADTGGESVINRVIRTADSVATQSLDAIERGEVPFNRMTNSTEWYDGIRIIRPNKETYDVWL